MFTECPTCNTVFRVQPSQLELAGGRVRCGECLAVFDAREYRRDDLEEPAPQVPSPPEPPEPVAAQVQLPFQEPDLFAQELAAALGPEVEPEKPAPPLRDTKPVTPPEPPPAEAPPPRPARPPMKRKGDINTLDLPFGPDFGTPARPPRTRWLAAGLLLLALLAGQYLWFYRLPLSQVPALQPAVSALCGLLPCGLESVPDPTAFELTDRAVQSHPSFEGALLVDITFVNRTNMARPYPGLELVFTDMEGNLLASRRFSPKEYLGNPPQQPLAPGAEAHAVLELLDPGDLAAGYEFRFF